MAYYNVQTVIGNLGADAEVRLTPGGKSATSFRLAATRRSNTGEDRTEWFRCTWFGERGEKVAQYLQKGKQIMVTGETHNSTYEKDGVKVYSSEIWVNDVQLLGSKSDNEGSGNTTTTTQPRRAAAPKQEAIASFEDDDNSDVPF